MSDPCPTQRFSKCHRLVTRADFDAVFARRLRCGDGNMLIYAAWGHRPWSRLGIVVGRRYGSAVQRNAVKRRIREAFRLNRHALPGAMDIVVIPSAGRDLTLDACGKSLVSLCQRLQRRADRKGTSCDR